MLAGLEYFSLKDCAVCDNLSVLRTIVFRDIDRLKNNEVFLFPF